MLLGEIELCLYMLSSARERKDALMVPLARRREIKLGYKILMHKP